jgi:hypothetical protein
MKQMSWKKSALILIILIMFVLTHGVFAQQGEQEEELPRLAFDEGIAGKLEVEVHGGYWTLDIFKGLFEDDLTQTLSDEIAKAIGNEISDSGYNIVRVGKEHRLVFGSSGSVFGFELRFYPGGRYSSFSLGVSIEKTHMEATVKGPVTVQFNDGSHAEMDAVGNVVLNPLFTNLSFRWDIKPEWAVTPYFVLGLGIAALNGEVSYRYNGTYFWSGGTEEYDDDEKRDIKEAEEDADFNMPNILPLLQINLGVRAEVIPQLHFRAEVGIWDGLILRAGIAYKF